MDVYISVMKYQSNIAHLLLNMVVKRCLLRYR
jgi:hypothetical protein